MVRRRGEDGGKGEERRWRGEEVKKVERRGRGRGEEGREGKRRRRWRWEEGKKY